MEDVYKIQRNEINLIKESVSKLEMYYKDEEAKEFIDIVTNLKQEIGSIEYYKQQILHSALQKLGYSFYINAYYDTKSLFNLASFLDAVWGRSIEYVTEPASFIYDSISAPKYDTPPEKISFGLKPLLTFAETYAKQIHEKRKRREI